MTSGQPTCGECARIRHAEPRVGTHSFHEHCAVYFPVAFFWTARVGIDLAALVNVTVHAPVGFSERELPTGGSGTILKRVLRERFRVQQK